jgi:hypothetical protein
LRGNGLRRQHARRDNVTRKATMLHFDGTRYPFLQAVQGFGFESGGSDSMLHGAFFLVMSRSNRHTRKPGGKNGAAVFSHVL